MVGTWENDETVQEAAVREAIEEAGVRGELMVILILINLMLSLFFLLLFLLNLCYIVINPFNYYSHLIFWRSWSWSDFYVSIVSLSVCLILPCLSWTAFGEAIKFCFLFVYICLVSRDCRFRCLNFNTDKTLIAVAIIMMGKGRMKKEEMGWLLEKEWIWGRGRNVWFYVLVIRFL